MLHNDRELHNENRCEGKRNVGAVDIVMIRQCPHGSLRSDLWNIRAVSLDFHLPAKHLQLQLGWRLTPLDNIKPEVRQSRRFPIVLVAFVIKFDASSQLRIHRWLLQKNIKSSSSIPTTQLFGLLTIKQHVLVACGKMCPMFGRYRHELPVG